MEVKSPQVELLAFGEGGMNFDGLAELLVGRLALRLVGGLGEVVWLWRVGVGEGSVEK